MKSCWNLFVFQIMPLILCPLTLNVPLSSEKNTNKFMNILISSMQNRIYIVLYCILKKKKGHAPQFCVFCFSEITRDIRDI